MQSINRMVGPKERNSQIMKTRALNEVETIKYRLAKNEQICIYNDFIIIGQIVRNLPHPIVLELLTLLKQFNDYIKQSSNLTDLTISPLLETLAKAPSSDLLLSDFLHASGYNNRRKTSTWWRNKCTKWNDSTLYRNKTYNLLIHSNGSLGFVFSSNKINLHNVVFCQYRCWISFFSQNHSKIKLSMILLDNYVSAIL